MAKITINRPEVRNAFRPLTVEEMKSAFADARDDIDIGVVILCGAGGLAFVPVAISASGEKLATLTKAAYIALTSWIFKDKFAHCQNR